MSLLIFDIVGKFAHWKKFYTNSSSLTYYYPTRTNIIGILASILEEGRDSYYETFSSEKLKIGVSLRSKVRKNIFVMNYRDGKEYTQIKLELLLPEKMNSNIRYRIFLYSENNETKEKIKKLKEKIFGMDLGYGVYLGQRQFRGWIEFIPKKDTDKLILLDDCKSVNSIVLKENIEGDLVLDDPSSLIIKERVPYDFNIKREIKSTKDIIGELNHNSVSIKNGKINNCLLINYGNIKENISFI